MVRRNQRPPLPGAIVEAVLRYHDDVVDSEGRVVRTEDFDRLLADLAPAEANTLKHGNRHALLTLHGEIGLRGVIVQGEPSLAGQTTDAVYVFAGPKTAAPSPPRRGEQLLCLIYSPDRLEDVAGTMAEMFHQVAARHGSGFAGLWYWWQIAGCVLGRLHAVAASASELAGLKRT